MAQVVFKGKTLEDSLKVSLIRASDVRVADAGAVQAFLYRDHKSSDAGKAVQNAPCELNPDGMNTVSSIKIGVSTRMTVAPLMLSCTLTLSSGKDTKPVKVAGLTQVPYEIVAITNESQWLEAEGKLLCSDLFSGSLQDGSAPWPCFGNVLHRRFLKGARSFSRANAIALTLLVLIANAPPQPRASPRTARRARSTLWSGSTFTKSTLRARPS